MKEIHRHHAADMEWKRLVPASLWDVDRRLLFDYLIFANRPEGANGSELQHEFGIDRNHQTRLTQRLVDAQWLVSVSRGGSDNRKHFVRTTRLAMSKKSELECALWTTMRPVPVPKSGIVPQGQRSIFVLDDPSSDD